MDSFSWALLAVLVPGIGHKALGARRWIKVGPILFQPSEWMKLVMILTVARYFANLGGRNLTLEGDLQGLRAGWGSDAADSEAARPWDIADLHPGPDDRAVSGRNQPEAVADSGAAATVLVVGGWSSGKLLKPYQKARLTGFINPDNDPRGAGYQVLQAKIAVGAGGIWGKGAEKGTQTPGAFIPIPHADFIFAAFSEEHGFVGAVFVLLLYFLILMRLIQNAQTAADLPGSLIIMGIVAVLTFQIAVNVGMVIGFMPVTGIPLPLMSYGGSSVLFTFLALGVVMNIRMRRFVN